MAVDKKDVEAAPADPTLPQIMHRMLEHMDNGRVQQVPLSKARIPTAWNPEGKKTHERARLARVTYQNGAPLVADRLTEDEIRAFNKLKAGRYGPEKAWVVIKRNDGSMELRYPNRTIEERMELGKYADGGIIGILNRIHAEYTERKDKRAKGILPEDEE